jgi:DNA-directed RNA polymerase subunit RPC12/RpoP
MSVFLGLAVFAIIIYFIYSNIARVKGYVCLGCGYDGPMKKRLGGSGFIELMLWLFFIIPGIIYTSWRGSKKIYTCPQCKNEKVVKASHPDAIALLERKSMVKCNYCAEEIKPDAKICKHCGKEVQSIKAEPVEVKQSSNFRMLTD